jgi:hypothetical protein
MAEDNTPFADLPAALVEEVLEQTSAVGDLLLKTFREVKNDRAAYRQALTEQKLILHESTLGYPPLPTTCAADGSYAIDRLLTVDLAAAAAVAVEGLTPPSEKRHWDRPHHSTYVVAEVHHADTATVLRAVMLGRELLLARKAPHDLVMLDMTLTLPIIYFNQALNQAPEASMLQCSHEFLSNCSDYLEAYSLIIRSERSDKNYVALPKYSTRREIGQLVGWPGAHDDRGFLTLVLQPGELTQPVRMEQPPQDWHLNTGRVPKEIRSRVDELAAEIVAGLNQVHIFYYKPHEWLPALRVEVSQNVGANKHRLSSVVQGLKHQCATASMLEPYPLYLADRMVKALARALPSFRQVTTQRISDQYEGDIGEVFFAMHGYRSESGG